MADSQRFRIIKKLGEAEGDRGKSETNSAEEKESKIDLETVIIAGLERGLSMQDVRVMQIGQLIDFIEVYNARQKEAEKAQIREETRGKRRKATQNDIDSFFG